MVQNISIVEGKNGLFVSMPAYKNSRGDYQDIAFPISKEFREKLYSAILNTYKIEKETPMEEKTSETKDKAKAKDDEFLDVNDKDSLLFR